MIIFKYINLMMITNIPSELQSAETMEWKMINYVPAAEGD